MSERPQVWVICAPFPGSGASTFARLLVDYYLFNDRDILVFDTDLNDRGLATRFPHVTQTIDLSKTPGQIALFDQLIEAHAVPRIVEISAQAHPLFISQARNIGFFEEAQKSGLDVSILFVSNGSRKAIEAGMMIQALWRSVSVIPIVNEAFVQLGGKLNDHLDSFPSRHSFQVPLLEPALRQITDAPNFSFARFLKTPPGTDSMSLVLRADLRSWVTRVFTQFRSHELRKALDESSLLKI